MRKSIVISFFVIAATNVYAQKDTVHLKNIEKVNRNLVTDRAPQALYFQLGGSAPILSVNYDRRFQKKVNGLGFAVGLGYFGVEGVSLFSIPASLNYLIGHSGHFIELAAGATFVSAQTSDFFGSGPHNSGSGFLYHINGGYRYQPVNGGFFFRGGISPLFTSAANGGGYLTSYYLGFGHNF